MIRAGLFGVDCLVSQAYRRGRKTPRPPGVLRTGKSRVITPLRTYGWRHAFSKFHRLANAAVMIAALSTRPGAAEHFYGLTGTRPTRITPTGGGKAYGPFLEFLATTYRILGIKASAENQAKAAINSGVLFPNV